MCFSESVCEFEKDKVLYDRLLGDADEISYSECRMIIGEVFKIDLHMTGELDRFVFNERSDSGDDVVFEEEFGVFVDFSSRYSEGFCERICLVEFSDIHCKRSHEIEKDISFFFEQFFIDNCYFIVKKCSYFVSVHMVVGICSVSYVVLESTCEQSMICIIFEKRGCREVKSGTFRIFPKVDSRDWKNGRFRFLDRCLTRKNDL